MTNKTDNQGLNAQRFDALGPIFDVFEAAGKKLYYVGGCVRDYKLGLIVKDFDFCTDALPEDTEKLLKALGAKVTDKRGGNYGTVHCVFKNEPIEITTFRVDKDYPMGDRRPIVEFSDRVEDDLKRRDFTINAMIADRNLSIVEVDGIEGETDLILRKLRSPQDPVKLMRDDPLRIMRMYRFAHRFDMTVTPSLRSAVRRFAPSLKIISRERIQDELIKIAGGPNPHLAFREMMEDGVMHQIIPELVNQVGYDQNNEHHHLPLWEHTLEVVRGAHVLGGNARVILAALFHDVAKPVSTQVTYKCTNCRKKTRILPTEKYQNCSHCGLLGTHELYGHSFKGHDKVGADMTRVILGRLKFSNDETHAIVKMVDKHINYCHGEWNTRNTRRFLNDMGELYSDHIILMRADRMAHAPGWDTTEEFDRLDEAIKTTNVEEVVKLQLPINGYDIMQVLDIKSGPRLGEINRKLMELVRDGDIATREEALEWLNQWR